MIRFMFLNGLKESLANFSWLLVFIGSYRLSPEDLYCRGKLFKTILLFIVLY